MNRGGARWQIVPAHEVEDRERYDASSQSEFSSVGAARRRGRHRHRRHARPEPGRGCRCVRRPDGERRAAATGCRCGCAGPPTSSASTPTRSCGLILGRTRATSNRIAFRRSNSTGPISHGCSRPPARTRTRSSGPGSASLSCGSRTGVQLTSTVDAPLPALRIAAPAKPFAELPDLKDCWAWAHGQAAAATARAHRGRRRAERSRRSCRSRGSCARGILPPNTDYLACVVPTFELGRKAGLGLADCRRRSHRGECARAGVDAHRDGAGAGAIARLLLVGIPHWRRRRFRIARASADASRRHSGLGTAHGRHRPAGVHAARHGVACTTVQMEGALMPLGGSAAAGAVVRSGRASLRSIAGEHRQRARPQPDHRTRRRIRSLRRRSTAAGMRVARVVTPGAGELAGPAEPRSALANGGRARHAGRAGAPGSADGVGVGTGGGDPARSTSGCGSCS